MMKIRGPLGLAIILGAEILLFAGFEPVARWFTPTVWIGYILLMDHVNHRLAGWSLMVDRRRAFLRMLPISIVCWTIFEVYNLHLKNWEYIELSENLWVRYAGYGVSFATVFPGIFQTYHFIDHLGIFRKLHAMRPIDPGRHPGVLIGTGVACLGIPLVLPGSWAAYLFGPVWIGLIFPLETINDRLGFRSFFGDLRRGDYSTLAGLFGAGAICGLLWEFWNYWATTKWLYTIPLASEPRYFEMPLLGFLGFLPFAVECWAMFNFCEMRVEGGRGNRPGRA